MNEKPYNNFPILKLQYLRISSDCSVILQVSKKTRRKKNS